MAQQFEDAEDVITQGMEGKWLKIDTPFERNVIVNSIAGCNLIRGTRNAPAIRHYERDGYLVLRAGPGDVETHPNDVKK